jgi:hypothetical protein
MIVPDRHAGAATLAAERAMAAVGMFPSGIIRTD